jgi:hypothetical protein
MAFALAPIDMRVVRAQGGWSDLICRVHVGFEERFPIQLTVKNTYDSRAATACRENSIRSCFVTTQGAGFSTHVLRVQSRPTMAAPDKKVSWTVGTVDHFDARETIRCQRTDMVPRAGLTSNEGKATP